MKTGSQNPEDNSRESIPIDKAYENPSSYSSGK